MSLPSWRKNLEEVARRDVPLARAIKAGLKYTHDLELMLQRLADELNDVDGGAIHVTRVAMQLLDRGGRPDHEPSEVSR